MRYLVGKIYTKFLIPKYQENSTLLGELINSGCDRKTICDASMLGQRLLQNRFFFFRRTLCDASMPGALPKKPLFRGDRNSFVEVVTLQIGLQRWFFYLTMIRKKKTPLKTVYVVAGEHKSCIISLSVTNTKEEQKQIMNAWNRTYLDTPQSN